MSIYPVALNLQLNLYSNCCLFCGWGMECMPNDPAHALVSVLCFPKMLGGKPNVTNHICIFLRLNSLSDIINSTIPMFAESLVQTVRLGGCFIGCKWSWWFLFLVFFFFFSPTWNMKAILIDLTFWSQGLNILYLYLFWWMSDLETAWL